MAWCLIKVKGGIGFCKKRSINKYWSMHMFISLWNYYCYYYCCIYYCNNKLHLEFYFAETSMKLNIPNTHFWIPCLGLCKTLNSWHYRNWPFSYLELNLRRFCYTYASIFLSTFRLEFYLMSKLTRIKEGEKSSNYFFPKNDEPYFDSAISKIRTENVMIA